MHLSSSFLYFLANHPHPTPPTHPPTKSLCNFFLSFFLSLRKILLILLKESIFKNLKMSTFNFLPFFWLIIFFLSLVTSQDINENPDRIGPPPLPPPPPPLPPPSGTSPPPFRPGVAASVGALTTIFSITFLLLLYVKHCKRGSVNYVNNYRQSASMAARKNSGIDPKVIANLPIFRFKSLRGQKDGLECAVCLNRFEPAEVLRLLPKCKHAFHVECVDTWLDAHSTCPLCRYRVDPEDILLVDYENKSLHNHDQSVEEKSSSKVSPRLSGRHSSAGERGNSLEIIVEQPDENSGRRSLDSRRSGKKFGSGNESRRDGLLLEKQKHRLEHRIIISDVCGGVGGGGCVSSSGSGSAHDHHRWSDVQPPELLYLRSEMIMSTSLGFSRRRERGGDENEEAGEGSGRGVINGRSVSEITGMSRYRSNGRVEAEGQRHEGFVKRWLAWISQSQHQKKTVVQSVRPSDSSSSSNGSSIAV